ncbi:transcriptional regulator, TetR family [Nocardia nova SH22a]|uniref:Transcriptional regulator, TetR family n=1 Tax=Nocardia nova SH22a TaxID=1415166 RepID=W5TRP7_9NOCA|nr:TetR/AcrR family transcriptional regulator [Nocardia nova]AHH19886.1 transcriptional regulator, TetR family [Nocardia nova SH22a]
MSASGWALGKKVGRKPAFTADEVVQAALELGIATFTLAAVANRLGVVTAAIYRLFPSRDDIVVACLDTAAATIRRPGPGTDWPEVLRLWADECWRVCEEYPGLERVVYSFAPAFTRISHILGEYSATMAAQGVTEGQAMFALDFIGDTVFACHLGVEAMRAIDDNGATGLDQVREALGDDSTVLRPRDSWKDRGMTDIKVDFIISGLAHHWPEM